MAHRQQQNPSSCLERGLMGLALGGLVGSGFGIVIGGYMAKTMGLKGVQLLKIIGKTSLSSGAAFGGFMCIGSLVRCEEKNMESKTQQLQNYWWKHSKFLMVDQKSK
eukprot:TRINITY_DN511_c0_g1_i1.p2 TRINITY_DN511_c0_g1~~TRINITY_DN511_c0_g1_i1.p2  ORF type:complete len:107 (+),score=26.97 TRINITY_DN511_c0_g1_i1:142-462(+)